jgi:hypothetical protein
MSDLKLVPPEKPTPLEQRLLDAAANEAPSAEQRMRVRLALGLPPVASAPTPMAAAPTPLAPVGRRALMLKVAGGLAVASIAAVALLIGMGRKSSADKAPVAPPVTQQTSAAPFALAPGAAPTPEPAPVAAIAAIAPEASEASETTPAPSAATPNHEARDDRAPSKHSSKPAVVDSGADLSEQLRLIDQARSAVAAGNASAASVALSTYRARFPRGPFGQEAAVLQIETLDLQGNHAQAAAQARTFLARHPNSPHVSVVQRIANR